METRDNDRKKKGQQTPIIDGDARPDMNVHGDEKRNQLDHPIPTPRDRDRETTTKNRNDSNSLEDYKDAKQE
jgi:hypothetical protein